MATQAQPVDTSDARLIELVHASFVAYDKFLQSGELADLQAWVDLDREKSRVRDARTYAKALQVIQ